MIMCLSKSNSLYRLRIGIEGELNSKCNLMLRYQFLDIVISYSNVTQGDSFRHESTLYCRYLFMTSSANSLVYVYILFRLELSSTQMYELNCILMNSLQRRDFSWIIHVLNILNIQLSQLIPCPPCGFTSYEVRSEI